MDLPELVELAELPKLMELPEVPEFQELPELLDLPELMAPRCVTLFKCGTVIIAMLLSVLFIPGSEFRKIFRGMLLELMVPRGIASSASLMFLDIIMTGWPEYSHVCSPRRAVRRSSPRQYHAAAAAEQWRGVCMAVRFCRVAHHLCRLHLAHAQQKAEPTDDLECEYGRAIHACASNGRTLL